MVSIPPPSIPVHLEKSLELFHEKLNCMCSELFHDKLNCMCSEMFHDKLNYYVQGKYVQKQASLIWKLFTLLLLGLNGIFMCFLIFYQRIVVGKSIKGSSLENKTHHMQCQQPYTHSFLVHYPQPSSYNRYQNSSETCSLDPFNHSCY